jgi:hypothetical protein
LIGVILPVLILITGGVDSINFVKSSLACSGDSDVSFDTFFTFCLHNTHSNKLHTEESGNKTQSEFCNKRILRDRASPHFLFSLNGVVLTFKFVIFILILCK